MRTALLVAALAVLAAPVRSQTPAEPPRRPTLEDVLVLVDVGVPEGEIVAYLDEAGWPELSWDEDPIRLREAGVGARLRGRLLRGRGRTDRELLAERYEAYDARLGGGVEISLLKPRGWLTEAPVGEKRQLAFHEHDQKGWFVRASLFLWLFDKKEWSARNEEALARIAFDAVRRRLAGGGLRSGETGIGLLAGRDGEPGHPHVHALFTDTRTRLRGMIGVTALVDDTSGLIAIMGYSARIDGSTSAVARARDQLTELRRTLQIKRRER